MLEKKEKNGLIVLITIFVVALLFTFARNFFSVNLNLITKNSDDETQKSLISKKNSGEYFAVLYITGTIQEKNNEYNQQWLLKTIKGLKNDSKNSGILLFIDSPGGTVYHSDEAYLALLDYKSSGKKIYSYFASMAASGGYYIGCAGDKIFANRNCLTGSIGVISASSVDVTGLLEKIGIKAYTIHTGKNKTMLNPSEPLTDEQQKIMQSLSDEAYEQFTQIVAESRKMDIEKVKTLADGRIYSALQAKNNGLVDEVFTLEEAKSYIKNESQTELSFKTFKYERPDNIMTLLEGLSFLRDPQKALFGTKGLCYLYN